jgi:hypothetical protein
MIKDSLKELEQTLLSKGHDYGSELETFEFAAVFADIPIGKVFMVMIGIKVSRLRNLQVENKEPKNESLADTLKDLAGYSVIFHSHLNKKK